MRDRIAKRNEPIFKNGHNSALTHTIKEYPSRVRCNIDDQVGSIMLDQIRTVDKIRIGDVLGQLSLAEINEVKYILNQMLC